MKRIIIISLSLCLYYLSLAQTNTGDIVITEIMNNPKAVTDANGEWFEIYNTTTDTINLKNWTIKDNGANNHIITSNVLVNPKSTFVMCRQSDSILNGGLNPGYSFSFSLANSDDEIIIIDSSGSVVDQVYYDESNGFPDSDGASIVLDIDVENSSNAHLDNDLGTNWKLETNNIYGSGDYGTPNQLPTKIITNLLWPSTSKKKPFTVSPTIITDQKLRVSSDKTEVIPYTIYTSNGSFVKSSSLTTNDVIKLNLTAGVYIIMIKEFSEKIIIQ